MSERKTYTEGRRYSVAVMEFRQSVYAARGLVTPMCQVLLLRLSDDMDAKCYVRVPRSQLAAEFDCAPPRVTEWVKQAIKIGFLHVQQAGRPGRVTEYQGHPVNVERVRPRVPSRSAEPDAKGTPSRTPTEVRHRVPKGYGSSDPLGVRPRVPTEAAEGYAQPPTFEVVLPTTPQRIDKNPFEDDEDEDAFEEPSCEHHEPGYCPRSCDNHPANSRRTA